MLTDIIIPTYKQEDYTVACIESIKRCTTKGDYQIIWVDNASPKKSRAKVEKALEGMDHIAILLEENTGFVGAINAGIKASTAPVLCFQNNDTILTQGWLDKLGRLLFSDKNMGIVGPLGQPGSGHPATLERLQKIHKLPAWNNKKTESDIGNLEAYNRLLERDFAGASMAVTKFIAFSCALLKREVIEDVGELDPNYGIGFWDDVDYGHFARKAGWKMAVALDTLIYHKGRTTFDLIRKEGVDVDKIHNENFEYMSSKRKGKAMLDTDSAKPMINKARAERLKGKTMNVTFLRSIVVDHQPRFAGQTHELPEAKAKQLIKTGRAEEATTPQPEPEPTIEEIKADPVAVKRTAIKKAPQKRGR